MKTGALVYDSEIHAYGRITDCSKLKCVQVEYLEGGFGYYNMDSRSVKNDVKILAII